MKITDIEVFQLLLPMRQNFSISGGSVGDQSTGAPHVYVKATADNGAVGWGEARPSPRWSYETLESAVTTITRYLRPKLIGLNAFDVRMANQVMNREIKPAGSSGQPIAKAAVDTALYDLIGVSEGKRLTDLWFGSFRPATDLSYLISTSDPEEAGRRAAYANRAGYKGVDVKIGLDPRIDIDVLEAVKASAPSLYFRVDANQAYLLPQALKLAKRMERIGVDVFEQPLRANDLAGHAQLRRKTSVPIALDESIWTASDIVQAIRAEACDTAVIKLTKMGGLSGAKLCGEIAREAGLELLGGGLTESRLGLAASAHLFNYLQIETPVDLNGPLFLGDDPVATGPQIDEGRVTLSDRPGIGCEISYGKLQQYAVS